MNQLSVSEMNNQPSTMTASNAVFNPQALGQLTSFANLMADSSISVPAHFAGKPADCMAVVMQAMQWGMNPYAVAQKTHLINGVLGYEAQLVNAVISSSNAIVGRFHYEYEGDWSKCTRTREETVRRPAKGGGTYDKVERVRGWTDEDEIGLSIRVGAILRGETEITWGEPVFISGVVIRNSPLWVSNPKQQIAYLAVKYWARLYCPEVILGVYTPDEVEIRTEREINPAERPVRATITDMAAPKTGSTTQDKAIEGEMENKEDQGEKLEADFLQKIDSAGDCEVAAAIRSEIEEKKNDLGRSRYTALKGKAVAKYHHIDARNAVEAAINSLDAGSEFAANDFARTEQLVNSRKNHLGPDLYEKFMINMNDMRPEFQQ